MTQPALLSKEHNICSTASQRPPGHRCPLARGLWQCNTVHLRGAFVQAVIECGHVTTRLELPAGPCSSEYRYLDTERRRLRCVLSIPIQIFQSRTPVAPPTKRYNRFFSCKPSCVSSFTHHCADDTLAAPQRHRCNRTEAVAMMMSVGIGRAAAKSHTSYCTSYEKPLPTTTCQAGPNFLSMVSFINCNCVAAKIDSCFSCKQLCARCEVSTPEHIG
jgi:hypothetical protein